MRRTLAAAPLTAIRAQQPQLPFKYLRRNYLAANLGQDRRAQILCHHYDYAAERMTPAALGRLAAAGVSVWRGAGPASQHQIRLILAAPVDNEGEFALQYRLDDVIAGILAFSFAPAAVFGLAGDTVPLVSRIQSLDDGPMLRRLAKEHHDIAPRFALAAALQGLAVSLGLDGIAAVSRNNQVAFKTDRDAVSRASYDAFYEMLSGREGPPGFFTVPVPFPEKDLAQVSPAHRRRNKRKRAARRAIADAVEAAMAALLRHDGNEKGAGFPARPIGAPSDAGFADAD